MPVEVNEDGLIVNTDLVKREDAARGLMEFINRGCPCTVPKVTGNKCPFGLAGCHACISNHAEVGELPACCLPRTDLVDERLWRSPWAWVVYLVGSEEGRKRILELPEELQEVVMKALDDVKIAALGRNLL